MNKLSKTDKIHGGLADKKQPSDFDADALRQGVEVELEHTDDPDVALEIAMDHLSESESYYRDLKHLEEKRASSKIRAGDISKAFFQPA